jgi:hypothetical protein
MLQTASQIDRKSASPPHRLAVVAAAAAACAPTLRLPQVISDWRAVALAYVNPLSGWFLLDFVSSIPWNEVGRSEDRVVYRELRRYRMCAPRGNITVLRVAQGRVASSNTVRLSLFRHVSAEVGRRLATERR